MPAFKDDSDFIFLCSLTSLLRILSAKNGWSGNTGGRSGGLALPLSMVFSSSIYLNAVTVQFILASQSHVVFEVLT